MVKNSLTADRGLSGYHILDRCAIDVQPITELAGADLDPLLLALQPYAVELEARIAQNVAGILDA